MAEFDSTGFGKVGKDELKSFETNPARYLEKLYGRASSDVVSVVPRVPRLTPLGIVHCRHQIQRTAIKRGSSIGQCSRVGYSGVRQVGGGVVW